MANQKQASGIARVISPLACCLFVFGLWSSPSLAQQYPSSVDPNMFHPGYYAFIPDHESIPMDVLVNPDFAGVKIKYRWHDLEVAKDVYDFSRIEADLETLKRHGKQLFIHITYVEWSDNSPPKTPEYMWTDSSYGGSLPYYGSYKRTVQAGGWYPLFWNTNVRRQIVGLFKALAERFRDEEFVEGLVIPETAAARTDGFDCDGYQQTLKETALAAKAAMGRKVVKQQINFACFDLQDHAAWLAANEVSIGAPDLNVTETLPTTTYPLFPKYRDVIPVGPDVQWDNYHRNNMSVREIRDYIIDNLNPWYVFWRVREPYFTDEVMPAVFSRKLPAAEQFYGREGANTRPQPPKLLD